MPYYPVFVDISGKPCLVIGGGAVAERKVFSLISAGAEVTVLSPRLTKTLKGLAKPPKRRRERVRHIPARYSPGSLIGYFLVISATDSPRTNRLIAKEAEELGVLLNVVDNPKLCNFIVPSVMRRGELTVAVSSSGKSPLMARLVRERLERALPEETKEMLEVISALRNKLLKKGGKNVKNRKLYSTLASSDELMELIRQGDEKKVNALLRSRLGRGFSLSALGVRLSGDKAIKD